MVTISKLSECPGSCNDEGSVTSGQEAEIVLCDLFDVSNNFSQFELGCAQNSLMVVIQIALFFMTSTIIS
jgi:hypothetical protein